MSETNSSNCNHNCADCQAECSSREIPKDVQNQYSNIKKIIAVVSGKGGVGKSTVCTLLAKDLVKKGHKVGIMDADITGPSIPLMLSLKGPAYGEDNMIIPLETKSGIKVISAQMLLDDQESPVIWRGPILAGMVRQFFTEVKWGDLDYLIIDLPPGTGDVPLTVFQSIPLNGILIVTTPQELVTTIVMKAVNMAKMMNIPIIGVVENMSYVKCPDCGKEIEVFGPSHLPLYKEKGLSMLDRLPLEPLVTQEITEGKFTETKLSLPKTIESLEQLPM